MCGLVAIYGYHESADQVDKSELIKIRDHMIDRGPDAKGIWFSNDNLKSQIWFLKPKLFFFKTRVRALL